MAMTELLLRELHHIDWLKHWGIEKRNTKQNNYISNPDRSISLSTPSANAVPMPKYVPLSPVHMRPMHTSCAGALKVANFALLALFEVITHSLLPDVVDLWLRGLSVEIALDGFPIRRLRSFLHR